MNPLACWLTERGAKAATAPDGAFPAWPYAELALEVAPIYFKYGSCLFYKAQDEADILGDQGQSAASKRDTGNDAVRRGRSCSVVYPINVAPPWLFCNAFD